MATNAPAGARALLASAALFAFLPPALAEPRSATPIQYASLTPAQPAPMRSKAVKQTYRIPRLNPVANADSWRGPVTKTGSAPLPDVRQRISFSYPGSVRTPSTLSSAAKAPQASPTAPKTTGLVTVSQQIGGDGSMVTGRMAAGHATLPLGSLVHVQDPASRKEIVVRVTSRTSGTEADHLVLSATAGDLIGMDATHQKNVIWKYLGASPATQPPTPASRLVAAPRMSQPESQIDPKHAQRIAPFTPARPEMFVQVGSFANINYANNAAARVGAGFSSTVRSVDIKGKTWHRVMVGPFTSERTADQARMKLRHNGFKDGFIIKS